MLPSLFIFFCCTLRPPPTYPPDAYTHITCVNKSNNKNKTMNNEWKRDLGAFCAMKERDLDNIDFLHTRPMAVIVDRYAANVINSDFIDNIRMDIDNCPWPCLENYDDWGDYKFFQNLFFPSLTSYGDRSRFLSEDGNKYEMFDRLSMEDQVKEIKIAEKFRVDMGGLIHNFSKSGWKSRYLWMKQGPAEMLMQPRHTTHDKLLELLRSKYLERVGSMGTRAWYDWPLITRSPTGTWHVEAVFRVCIYTEADSLSGIFMSRTKISKGEYIVLVTLRNKEYLGQTENTMISDVMLDGEARQCIVCNYQWVFNPKHVDEKGDISSNPLQDVPRVHPLTKKDLFNFNGMCGGTCSLSGKTIYCSKECQLKDWIHHKKVCKKVCKKNMKKEEKKDEKKKEEKKKEERKEKEALSKRITNTVVTTQTTFKKRSYKKSPKPKIINSKDALMKKIQSEKKKKNNKVGAMQPSPKKKKKTAVAFSRPKPKQKKKKKLVVATDFIHRRMMYKQETYEEMMTRFTKEKKNTRTI